MRTAIWLISVSVSIGARARRCVVDVAEDGLAAEDGLNRGGNCDREKGQAVEDGADDFHEVLSVRETR